MAIAAGAGRYDGSEVLTDGRIVVSAWNDSTVSVVSGDTIRPLLRGIPNGADIGVNLSDRVVAVPLPTEDRVELWRLPRR